MRQWEEEGTRRIVTNDEGVVVFEARSGHVSEEINGECTRVAPAVLITTDNDLTDDMQDDALLERVMAALRTHEFQRAKNARLVAGPDGEAYLRTTHYEDGDRSVLEIKWLKRDPTEKEIAAVEQILKELASELAPKYAS
jgi:hypothetical protein